MRYLLTAVTLAFVNFCYASETPYAASAIPAALLKDANVVKRLEEVRFEIISTGETILHRKYALTVLNENGNDNASFSEYYDKLKQIKSIDGALYDGNGKLIKRLKSKEIQDRSGVDNNDLMDDHRVKMHNFYYKEYPYTVEYEVEIQYNNSLFFPHWLPQEDENFSVEKSSFTLVAPANYVVRNKVFNYNGQPLVSTEKNKTVTTWQVSNLTAIKSTYAAPAWQELTTVIFFGPTEFEIQGYKGNMSNWQEFSKFVYSLKKDRDALPEAVKQKVQELTAGLTTDQEKIKVLYQYLQQHTRYVGVQLGIGGWQPFDANYVAQNGYGDCKALTNYMYSLLKAAGIQSYYTLVNAGSRNRIIDDFPSQQFNHVILSVPLQKDTMWLECTNQTLPAGYVSDFTANRKALVICEQGGTLVQTPRYGVKENLQLRSVKGTVDEQGNLTAVVDTRYTAIRQDYLHDLISSLSKDKVKEKLQEELELATYNVNNFTYNEKKDVKPEIKEDLNIAVNNYASITGKRLFITPNLLNRSSSKLNDEERLYDFEFDYGYTDRDSVEIEIPAGYEPEALPQDVVVSSEFGAYRCATHLSGNKVVYYREREQYEGKFPAKDYAQLVSFYAAIYKADRNRVVLVKKG